MNKNEHALTEKTVEEELAAFRPFPGSAFAGEVPSPRTLGAIHTAARRHLFLRRVYLVTKLAAVFCVLFVAAKALLPSSRPAHSPTLIRNESPLSEEELLLDIQGMDDESFFSPQEEAFLL